MPLSRAQRVQVRRLSEGLQVDRSILGDTTARAGFKVTGKTANGFNSNRWRVTTKGMEKAFADLARLSVVAESVANQVIGEEAQNTVAIIKAKWPVDTGASKSRWGARRVRQGRVTRWTIANDIPYLKYIHRSGSKAILVETMVPAEIEDMQRRINSRIQKLIRQRTRARTPLRAQALATLT